MHRCCKDKNKNANNLKFLKKFEAVITDKRSQGMEVIISEDLNLLGTQFLMQTVETPPSIETRWFLSSTWKRSLVLLTALGSETWREDVLFVDGWLLPQARLPATNKKAVGKSYGNSNNTGSIVRSHRLLAMKLKLGRDPVAGHGIWRHNDSLLKDQEFIKTISDTIQDVKAGTFEDGTAQWKYCKFRIKDAAINFSRTRARV